MTNEKGAIILAEREQITALEKSGYSILKKAEKIADKKDDPKADKKADKKDDPKADKKAES